MPELRDVLGTIEHHDNPPPRRRRWMATTSDHCFTIANIGLLAAIRFALVELVKCHGLSKIERY